MNRYTCVNPGSCDCGRDEGEFCRHWPPAARRPVDDALDRLERDISFLESVIRSDEGYTETVIAQCIDAREDIATVRDALERLRAERDALDRLRQQINKSRATYVPGTPEKYPATELRGLTVLEAEALLAQAEQLREERDAAKRELREFEHVDGEPLYETAAVAASSFVFARHRAEAAEAEVRRLKQENDELAEQAYQDRSKAQRLTEGLRELEEYTSALFTYAMECEQLLSEAGIELPDASRIHEPSVREPGELGEKVRALLSANPPKGDAAAGSSPSDDKPAICHICGNTVEGEHKIWCSASPSDGGGAK